MATYDTKTSWPMRIGLLLAPLMFLFFLEIALRVFGIGSDHPLYYREVINGKEMLTLNSRVTQRYFDLPDNLLPELETQSIAAQKAENELRVVCIGGSTTAGFPYEINATFPFQLEWRLRKALMDNKVEVINLGISAVNSHTFVDLMPEILALEPDALLIYLGHNEFYGALGVASTQSPLRHHLITKAYLQARRLYSIQLLRQALRRVTGFILTTEAPEPSSLMKLMAKNQEIPLTSELVREAADQLKANLSDIIQTARDDSVYVVVSNLVANLKDHRPFVSRYANAADSARIEARLYEAQAFLQVEDDSMATQVLEELFVIDSTLADLAYLRGHAALQAGNIPLAQQHFAEANDLDMLRFRAPRHFNQIIHEVARATNIPFLDMAGIFEAASGGVPGKTLFHEHLHPNFDGYRLMAQAFFEALYTIQFNNPLEPVIYRKPLLKPIQIRKVLDFYRKENGGITDLDLAFGRHRVNLLMQRWPFSGRTLRGDSLIATNPILEDLTKRHLSSELFWDAAHYELADHYVQQGDLDAAIREYRAVSNAFPENSTPMMKVGDLNLAKDRPEISRRWYVNALQVDPENAELLLKAGHAHTLRNMIADAGRYLQAAIQQDSLSRRLTDLQRSSAFYLLGLNYANSGNFRLARAAIGQSLRITPGYAPAEKLLKDLP